MVNASGRAIIKTRPEATTKALAVCILVAGIAMASPPALAYRPFDSTDASVADEGEFELELGPVGFLREGTERSWIAPAVIANFGLAGNREIVLEGKLKSFVGDVGANTSRTSLVDTALSLKQVHRHGSLQDGTGVSIASECGILLPTIHGEPGAGVTCAGIMSQRWPMVTVHLNAALTFNRQHSWERFLGGIIEGPSAWTVRPVAEVFTEQEINGPQTNSVLVGLIWRARENLSFDLGVRSARGDDQHINEVRAGLTWTMSPGK